MKLGAGVEYFAGGKRPPVVRGRRRRAGARALGALGDDTGDDIMPLQSDIQDLIRTFNTSGFTPAQIVPGLERAVAATKANLAAAQANAKLFVPVGNAAQSVSDAKNDYARAQRMLAQMQAQAAAGDQNIYSSPSPTWGAVKDAILGPYYWLSNQEAAMRTQIQVDHEIPAIVAQAVVEAPATFAHAVGSTIEYVRDNIVAPVLKPLVPDVPRWTIWAAGAGLLMFVARPYVAPLLKRAS
ncbi:MAG: hypothetical protein JO086_15175 [Acidimicrobiia bacterium]|nr:hypothetical protein [Acidimicrobiia bacterium]